jgi:hypothetical protein
MLWKLALGIYSATTMPANLDTLFSKVSPPCAQRNELRQAREEAHRFWMNNQPAVLNYERLEASIPQEGAKRKEGK